MLRNTVRPPSRRKADGTHHEIGFVGNDVTKSVLVTRLPPFDVPSSKNNRRIVTYHKFDFATIERAATDSVRRRDPYRKRRFWRLRGRPDRPAAPPCQAV
jgi:hypothetical protein